jgi:hypothetical protein
VVTFLMTSALVTASITVLIFRKDKESDGAALRAQASYGLWVAVRNRRKEAARNDGSPQPPSQNHTSSPELSRHNMSSPSKTSQYPSHVAAQISRRSPRYHVAAPAHVAVPAHVAAQISRRSPDITSQPQLTPTRVTSQPSRVAAQPTPTRVTSQPSHVAARSRRSLSPRPRESRRSPATSQPTHNMSSPSPRPRESRRSPATSQPRYHVAAQISRRSPSSRPRDSRP